MGGAPDTARDGVEADALNRYRLALGAEARKARRYPEVSRTRGQEGTAEVYVVLSRAGGTPAVIAGKSSGSATLDEGALVADQRRWPLCELEFELKVGDAAALVAVRGLVEDGLLVLP